MSREFVDRVLGETADKHVAQTKTTELRKMFTRAGHLHFVTQPAFMDAAYDAAPSAAGAAIHQHLQNHGGGDAAEGFAELSRAGHITRKAQDAAGSFSPGAVGGAARARRPLDLEGTGILLSKGERELAHRHHHLLHALAHGKPRERRELIEHMSGDHIRAVGAAVRGALHGGHVPRHVLETRGRMLHHLANPRASLRVKHRHLHSCPGVVAEALRGVL